MRVFSNYLPRLRYIGIALALMALAAACAGEDPTATPTPSPTPTAKPGATATATATSVPRATVFTAEGATPWVNTDPAYQNAKTGGILRHGDRSPPDYGFDLAQSPNVGSTISAFMPRAEKLVRFYDPDPAQPLVGQLAKSWEISGDGTEVTFHLRDGVRWHDGTDFTSADVVAEMTRWWDPPEGILSGRSGWFTPVTSIEAVDRLTVKVTTDGPFPLLLFNLAYGQMGIMQKATLEKHNYDLSGVVDYPGTGPFKYVSNTGKETWKYVRNDDYWNGNLPILDGLEYFGMTAETVIPALLAGRIDITKLVTLSDLASEPRIKTNTYSGYFDWTFHMNTDNPPFDDVRVRRAINLIFDRVEAKKGIDAVWLSFDWKLGSKYVPGGSAWEKDIAGSSFGDNIGFHSGGPTDAEIAEAQSLMVAAGYPEGWGTVELIVRPNLKATSIVHAQMLMDSVNKYLPGTNKFELTAVGKAELRKKIITNDFQTGIGPDLLGAIDHPGSWFGPWYRSGSGQNFSRYSNPVVDDLIDQMNTSADRAEIVMLVKQVIDILETDLPAIPVGVWPNNHDAWWDFVKGTYCTAAVTEHNQCNHWDTTWLDK